MKGQKILRMTHRIITLERVSVLFTLSLVILSRQIKKLCHARLQYFGWLRMLECHGKKKQWINLAKKRGITNLMFIHKKVGNTISVYYYCTYIFNKLRRLLCKRYHLKPVVQRYYKLSATQITYDITLNTPVLYCVMVVRPNRRLWLSRNKIWRRELQTILQHLQTFILYYYYYYIVRFHSRKRVKFCFSKTGWKLRELIPSIKLIPKVIPV